ncbi:MAG TPA: amidohydrolase family protein [Coriobacteriia bacterium]|jgi:5-methylthioadenosine/S-adenosylhomocysteine deaminase
MLVTADWVLPIDAAPIRRGGVLVRNGRIAEVGPADRLSRLERVAHVDFAGCAMVPGLVNAHTHLSLAALGGLLPSSDFATWLIRVVPLIAALDEDDMATSAALGALRCLQSGITVAGDIAYGPEALAAAADMGLGGVYFWEAFGIPASELSDMLDRAEFPHGQSKAKWVRARVGISPHTAYTSGPELLRAVAALAREGGYPLAVHVAESLAETRLFREGAGPLAAVAERLADGFEPPHLSPVAYLARLGVLDDALAVHCVHLGHGDVHTLAQRVRGVALCPLSNAFLHNGYPPVDALAREKVAIGIGTDSSASNEGIDLFAEARALRDIAPALPPERLLRMMTLEGAVALGVEASFGSLAVGKQADLALVRIGDADDPVRELIDSGAPASVEAVMSAGVWRMRGGRPAFNEVPVESAGRQVTDKVSAAKGAWEPGGV